MLFAHNPKSDDTCKKNKTLSSGGPGILLFLPTAGRATISAKPNKTLFSGESGISLFLHTAGKATINAKLITLEARDILEFYSLHTACRETITAKRTKL